MEMVKLVLQILQECFKPACHYFCTFWAQVLSIYKHIACVIVVSKLIFIEKYEIVICFFQIF